MYVRKMSTAIANELPSCVHEENLLRIIKCKIYGSKYFCHVGTCQGIWVSFFTKLICC
jgi:hypothetical protein